MRAPGDASGRAGPLREAWLVREVQGSGDAGRRRHRAGADWRRIGGGPARAGLSGRGAGDARGLSSGPGGHPATTVQREAGRSSSPYSGGRRGDRMTDGTGQAATPRPASDLKLRQIMEGVVDQGRILVADLHKG